MRNIFFHLAAILSSGPASASWLDLFSFDAPFHRPPAALPDVANPPPPPLSSTDLDRHPHDLLRRQSNTCPRRYTNCQHLGAPDLCCPPSTNCARDRNGNLACCPVGAVCTGVVASTRGGTAQPTATDPVGGVVGGTTTTTTGFAAPTTAVVGGGGSTVTNPYYPYPYIATTYLNAAGCSSAWTTCQAHSTQCAAHLGGQGGGITVSAPNGGVTVPGPATTYAPADARAICSSLSAEACYGLEVAACQAFGTGSGFVVGGDNAATGPRPTGCEMAYKMGAGLAMGVAGQLLAG